MTQQPKRSWRWAATVLLVSVSLLACSSSRFEGNGPQGAITYKPARSTEDNLLDGVLHGDAASGCLWLVMTANHMEQIHLYGPYVLRWSRGLVLYRNGRAIGREGSRVAFAGGALRDGPALTGCPVPGQPGSLRLD